MNLLIKATLKYFSYLYSLFRLVLWNGTRSKTKTIRLSLLKNQKFFMVKDGDIAKYLYSEQHLIPFKKSFEYSSLELFYNTLKPGDTVLDIGANVGIYSFLASKKIGTEGKVYAFEPTTETYQLLVKNLSLNHCDNVIPVKKALSDKKQKVVMKAPSKWKGKDTDGYNQMFFIQEGENEVDMMMTETLDDFAKIENIEKVNFIKVDIEGAELLFFKGAKNVLSKYKPTILFESIEVHSKAFHYNVVDVLVFLHDLGYRLEQINHEQWLAK